MRKSMLARRFALPIVVALLLSLVVGCGGGGQGGGQGGSGNTLTIGYDQEPPVLNPFIGSANQATNNMSASILDSPLQIRPDFSFAPELAEEMPEVVSEDPFVVEYRLKEGLTWSDGEPLTSADARFTYEQIMDPENQIITRVGWEQVESFDTPDDRTVRITFGEPYALWRDLLGNSQSAILPEHVYAEEDFNTALNNEVVGSGPYKLGEWRKGENLTLERNENYWGEAPAIEEITVRFIPDTNSLVTALQAGEVQFVNPPPDIGLTERLEEIEGTTVETAAGAEWEHIGFNLEEVDNLKLRQAIAYGIDRQQIVDEILPGQVRPLDSVVVPEQGDFYTPAWERYRHDPERARQLVEEARAEGAEPAITFSTTAGNKLRETLQEVVQQQLGEVGIEVEIDNADSQTFIGQWLPEGRIQMYEVAWLSTSDPTLTTLFSAEQVPPNGFNFYRYEDEEVTRLLAESDRAIDEGERAELLRRIQDLIAEDLPLIPMYQRPATYAFSESLSGPEVNPTLAGPFWNVNEWTLEQ